MNEREILDRLTPLIREVTGARPEQITPEANLMADLGAESLDLLDLSFLIEEQFGITIESDEFGRQATARLGGAPYERDGRLTEEALAELRRAMPEVPPNAFRPGLRPVELPSVLNVAVFAHLIGRKLAENEAAHA